MSLVRDYPLPMPASVERPLVTMSTLISTAGPLLLSTADALISTSTVGIGDLTDGFISTACFVANNGRVIDRLLYPVGGNYNAASVASYLSSTVGSTAAGRKFVLGVKLQHGDSSGAGDMADYSTGSQPNDVIYFGSTNRTSDMQTWDLVGASTGGLSTGFIYAASLPGYYDLRGAKRYIRVVGRFGINLPTTATADIEYARVGQTICFLAAQQAPAKADTTSPFSSTTTT